MDKLKWLENVNKLVRKDKYFLSMDKLQWLENVNKLVRKDK